MGQTTEKSKNQVAFLNEKAEQIEKLLFEIIVNERNELEPESHNALEEILHEQLDFLLKLTSRIKQINLLR